MKQLKTKSALRILLLQIRDEQQVRIEEHTSFAKLSGLCKAQIDVLNVFDTPYFPPEVIDNYDALFVGGASEASVFKRKEPFFPDCEAMLRYCVQIGKPVFASCFGFQLCVVALGGYVIRDEELFEMGTLPIRVTPKGQSDLLYHDIGDTFLAVSVHKEKALEPPPGVEVLAETDVCIHSFKVANKPFWAFQFHPEVDKPTLVERLTFFKEHYAQDPEQLEAVLQSAQDTPESNTLVKKFVDRVLLDASYLS